MTDIVERLRRLAELERPYGSLNDTLDEAAAEIERLREWNAEIALNAREFVAENEKLRAALKLFACDCIEDARLWQLCRPRRAGGRT